MTPFELVRKDLKTACQKQGYALDTYDPDFILGVIMASCQKNNCMITGEGVVEHFD